MGPPDCDLLGPRLSLSSHSLSSGPRCEFPFSPGPLPPCGPRTPGVPLHHQLYAGWAHHPHTHLHHLLHDSCTASGTAQPEHGHGVGPESPCTSGRGGPGLAHQTSCHLFGSRQPINIGWDLGEQTMTPAESLTCFTSLNLNDAFTN